MIAALVLCCALTDVAIAQVEDPDLDGIPGEAPAPAEPFAPAPSILTGTGSVLVDHSHANDFRVSGFTDFLVSQGWVVEEHLSGPITESVLDGHDILVIPTRSTSGPTDPFTTVEIAAIQTFLSRSNGLWMLNDNQDPSGMNTLSSLFGVVFQADAVRDSTNNEGLILWPTIYQLSPHPATSGVESYGYYLGDCLIVSSPSRVIAQADDDAYSFFCPAGSNPAVLAAWESAGRAVFCGDGTPLHPNYYPERLRSEEQLRLQNIVNWLLGDPPTSTSATTWGSVKAQFVDEVDVGSSE